MTVQRLWSLVKKVKFEYLRKVLGSSEHKLTHWCQISQTLVAVVAAILLCRIQEVDF